LVLVQGVRACELKLDSLYTACAGQAISIQVPANFDGFSVAGGSLVETLNYAQNGNYTVNAVTVSGCSASANIAVSISSPVINLPATQAICPGSSKTLDAGNPGATYVWSTGATTQVITVNAASSYTVTVTNPFGCSTQKTAIVTLSPAPIINLPATAGFCAGENVTLNSGNAGSTILWSTGATSPTITVNTAGDYSVTVTNILGCSTTDNSVVVENPLPVVDLGIDTTICVSQTPWTITPGSNFSVYRWSNSATTSSIQVSTTNSYFVTVTDANGCTGSDEVFVEVEICSGTNTPGVTGSINVFPNPSEGLVNLEMKQFAPGNYLMTIFNAQGQLNMTNPMEISTDQQLIQLDLSSYPKGAYIIKVASEKGIVVRRLILN